MEELQKSRAAWNQCKGGKGEEGLKGRRRDRQTDRQTDRRGGGGISGNLNAMQRLFAFVSLFNT